MPPAAAGATGVASSPRRSPPVLPAVPALVAGVLELLLDLDVLHHALHVRVPLTAGRFLARAIAPAALVAWRGRLGDPLTGTVREVAPGLIIDPLLADAVRLQHGRDAISQRVGGQRHGDQGAGDRAEVPGTRRPGIPEQARDRLPRL